MEEEGLMEEESFMDMLRAGDELEEAYIFSPPSSFPSPSYSSYYSATAAQMLCFGGKEEELSLPLHGVPPQKSSDSSMSSLSSSPSSTTTTNTITSAKTTKKKVGGCGGGGRRTASVTTTSTTITATKKPKTASNTTSKARKEKLGDRITALQQLVSPFGKSDTASVLHEALGYIRFLHDQVQALSSPYLQRLPSSERLHDEGRRVYNDLRSRGLCLVPVSCTEHVANSNGADLWSPSMGSSNCSSSSKH